MPGGSTADQSGFAVRAAAARDLAGGNVFSRFLIAPDGAVLAQPSPTGAVRRRAPAVFGIGLFDLVSDVTLQAIADPTDRNGDGISGRLASISGRAGRFGWKASVPSVDQFIPVALAAEMGLTTMTFRCHPGAGASCSSPPEVADDDVGALRDFVRSLAPPPLGRPARSDRGGQVFASIGCSDCHRQSLAIDAMNRTQTIDAYTDLLLHDMGPALAEPFNQGVATSQEFRTPPLWGVSSTGPPYLHDGRANSLLSAIEAHDGEAARSKARFRSLTAEDAQALMAFLRSL